jgi:hypothetical protein
MRVVQKNLVYVIGLHPKYATEDASTFSSTLYTLDYLHHATYYLVDHTIERLFWTIRQNRKGGDQQTERCGDFTCGWDGIDATKRRGLCDLSS